MIEESEIIIIFMVLFSQYNFTRRLLLSSLRGYYGSKQCLQAEFLEFVKNKESVELSFIVHLYNTSKNYAD